MSDLQQNNLNFFNTEQNKYIYYIMGLSLAAIGFTVAYTKDLNILSFTQIPLFMAVLSWCFSIICGTEFIKYKQSTLHDQNDIFNMQNGNRDKITKLEKSKGLTDAEITKLIINNIELKGEKMSKYGSYTKILLILGCGLFICWRLIEMIINTI